MVRSRKTLNFDRSLITRAGPDGLQRPRHFENGGGERIRTDDILLAKQALYQLSYAPSCELRFAAQLAVRLNKRQRVCSWWAREDLNLRPHAYQARALTN